MKKLFMYLLLGMFLINLVSSLDFDNVKNKINVDKESYLSVGTKTIPYKEIWETYKPIEIKNAFGLGATLFKGAITEHTKTCSDDCKSQIIIQTSSTRRLIDDLYFIGNQPKSYEVYINNGSELIEVDDFENICKDVLNKNGTISSECKDEKIGSHVKSDLTWEVLDITKDKPAGTYTIEIRGVIKNDTDWVIKTNGETLDSWAVWGTGGTIYNATYGTKDATSGGAVNAEGWNITLNRAIRIKTAQVYNWINGSAYIIDSTGAIISNVTLTSGVATFDKDLTTMGSYLLKFQGNDHPGYKITPGLNNYTGFNITQFCDNSGVLAECSVSANMYGLYNVTYQLSNSFMSMNSPLNNSLSSSNNPNFNCSATIIGATFVNWSLITNQSGTMTIVNTSTTNGGILNSRFSNDGKYLWSCKGCDSDGDCGFASENRTITIDSTPPSINILYPTGTINYGYVGQNVSLNFSVSDASLDSCWSTSYLTNLSKNTNFNMLNSSSLFWEKNEAGVLSNYTNINISSSCDNGGYYTLFYNTSVNMIFQTYYHYYCINSSGTFLQRSLELPSPLIGYTLIPAIKDTKDCSNNSSFLLLPNVREIYIYANDTIGNTNYSATSWDYNVFENSQSYNNETISGNYETFRLNTTIKSGLNINSANLIYNGTSYSALIYSSGQERNFEASLETPILTTDQNLSFYWNLIGSTFAVNTSARVQLVRPVLLDNCSSFTFKVLNISLYDERAKTPLTGNIEFNYQLLNSYSFSELDTINLSTISIQSLGICSNINVSNLDIFYSAEIKYSSDGYAPELYHIQRSELTEDIPIIRLYDLNSTDSTEFKITYQDDSYIYVEGAIVQLMRKYISENLYEIVEAPITSNEGATVVHIDLSTNKYQATIVKDGVILDFFDNLVFKCDSILTEDCTQKLLGSVNPSNEVNVDTLLDFSYSEPVISGDTITVFFSIPSNTPSTVNLVMTQKDPFSNATICNQTITSSAGSIQCNIEDTLGDSYLDLQIRKGNTLIASPSYIIPKDDDLDFLGNNFFILFIIALSLIMMALSSPEWIIVNGVITIIVGGALFLINGVSFVLGLGSVMWLLIAAGILIFKLAKQEDR